MLWMIGLGLGDERDITVRGMEAVKRCSKVRFFPEHCLATGGGRRPIVGIP